MLASALALPGQTSYQLLFRDSATPEPEIKYSLLHSNGAHIVNGKTISTSHDDFIAYLDSQDSMLWNIGFTDVRYYGIKESPDGGIVLAGQTFAYGPPPSAKSNIVIAKFDTAGALVWCHAVGDGNYNDAVSLVILPDSSIRVLAVTGIAIGVAAIDMIDFNPQGQLLNAKRINLNPFGSSVSACKLFNDGSAIVTFNSSGTIHTTMLDSSASIVWSRSYGLTGAPSPFIVSIEQMPNKDIVMAGHSQQQKALILCIDSAGTGKWARVETNNSSCGYSGITFDPVQQAVIVTGFCTEDFYGTNTLLRLYSLTGNLLYSRVYGDYFDDKGVCADTRNSLLTISGMAGTSANTGELSIIRGDSTGRTGTSCYRNFSFPSVSTNYSVSSNAITLTPFAVTLGDSIVANLPLVQRTFYRRSNCPRTSYTISPIVNDPYSIAYDLSDGSTIESGRNSLMAIGKLNRDGHRVWNYSYSLQSDPFHDPEILYDVKKNGANWEFCGGSLPGGSGAMATHGYVDSTGAVTGIGLYTAPGGLTQTNLFSDFISYADSSAILCGFSQITLQDDYFTLVKLDKQGHPVWSIFAGDSCSELPDLLPTGQGVILSMTAYGKDLLSAFDTSGQLLWSRSYSTYPYEFNHTDVTLYPNGDLLFVGLIDSAGQINEPYAMAARLDGNGNPVWARGYFTGANTVGRSVSMLSGDTAVIAGHYLSSQLTYYHAFCLVLAPDGKVIKSFVVENSNPSNSYEQSAIISDGQCGVILDGFSNHTRFYPFSSDYPCNVHVLPVQDTLMQMASFPGGETITPFLVTEHYDVVVRSAGLQQEIICFDDHAVPPCPGALPSSADYFAVTEPGVPILAYPVPAKGNINLVLKNHIVSQPHMLTFFDVCGRVTHVDLSSGEQQGRDILFATDISTFQPGFYVVQVSTGEKVYSCKIIVGEN